MGGWRSSAEKGVKNKGVNQAGERTETQRPETRRKKGEEKRDKPPRRRWACKPPREAGEGPGGASGREGRERAVHYCVFVIWNGISCRYSASCP